MKTMAKTWGTTALIPSAAPLALPIKLESRPGLKRQNTVGTNSLFCVGRRNRFCKKIKLNFSHRIELDLRVKRN